MRISKRSCGDVVVKLLAGDVERLTLRLVVQIMVFAIRSFDLMRSFASHCLALPSCKPANNYENITMCRR